MTRVAGPPGAVSAAGPAQHKFKSPADSVPVFLTRDRGPAEFRETLLDGELISCFYVGGEPRLCLPQILNTVLDEISLAAIHATCDNMHIFCSTCSKEQLEVLKSRQVLPSGAYQCGLITRSDAERLISGLIDRPNHRKASECGFNAKNSPFSFKVQHECFGKCEGLLLPEACTAVGAACIECLQCSGLFSPPQFVRHSHNNTESRTCHWGFDSNNWRVYLHLWEGYDEDEPRKEKIEKKFSDFKNRYANMQQQIYPNLKRKPVSYHHTTTCLCFHSTALSLLSNPPNPRTQIEP